MDAVTLSQSTTFARTALVGAALLLLAACKTASDADVANGDDPMRALEVTVLSTRYTSTYWQTQAETNPELWKRAVAYCEEHRKAQTGSKVNCGSVYNAQFEIAGRKPPVPRRRRDVSEQVFTP
jgi:hypothetical protein